MTELETAAILVVALLIWAWATVATARRGPVRGIVAPAKPPVDRAQHLRAAPLLKELERQLLQQRIKRNREAEQMFFEMAKELKDKGSPVLYVTNALTTARRYSDEADELERTLATLEEGD